jgi:TonB family protein
VLAVLVLITRHAGPAPDAAMRALGDVPRLRWIPTLGLGGGGGRGGDRTPGPARRATLPGTDRMTVPAASPRSFAPSASPVDAPDQRLVIDAQPLTSGVTPLIGSITGSLDALGAGPDEGPGDGKGRGPGLGDGWGGGCCEGVFQVGNGVQEARVLTQVRPKYTTEAMQARVQGVVWLEIVVRTDGSVGAVRVIRSLDPKLGLDQEAIKAARQWRFRPGTRMGQPVPVEITIELSFSLR